MHQSRLFAMISRFETLNGKSILIKVYEKIEKNREFLTILGQRLYFFQYFLKFWLETFLSSYPGSISMLWTLVQHIALFYCLSTATKPLGILKPADSNVLLYQRKESSQTSML